LHKSNSEILKQHLFTIKERGRGHCLTITTVGHLIYILNEGDGFYVLVVPEKKLTQTTSNQLLEVVDWEEKYSLSNYHKTFNFNSIEFISVEIDKILSKVLTIPKTRKWRFLINPGMMVIKSNEVVLNAKTRRDMNKKMSNTLSKKLLKYLAFPLSTNLNASIFATLILLGLIGSEKLKASTLNIEFLTFLLSFGIITYIILRLKYPDKK
jgi:hypothetical protein